MIQAKWVKQPGETLDYEIDFSKWAEGRSDTASSVAVTATGLTVVESVLSGWVARVTLAGGTDGQKYKVTVRLTTSTGRIREYDFQINVRES